VRRSSIWKYALAAATGLWLASGEPARAELVHADPIAMPAGPLPQPEDSGGAAPDRLERAAALLGARGIEPAYVAWALVESSRRSADPRLAERAVALAPEVPAVPLEAGWIWKRPGFLARGLAALPRSYPALLWIVVAGGAVLGIAIGALAALLQVFAAARGLPLLGHALAHRLRARRLSAWPGVMTCLALLALLAAAGAGPVALLALAGCGAALRLRPAESATTALGLLAAGLVLGPGLDFWARAATSLEPRGSLASAWRVERGFPLPGDQELLERAHEKRPGDPLVRLVLAKARVRSGDPAGALAILAAGDPADRPELRAAQASLRGWLELAAGNVGRAVEEYERARRERESAVVLFNLSQAYGRALRLDEQAPTFRAARALDPDAVERYARAAAQDPVHLLVPVHLPATLYLRRALSASPAAARLAGELRARLLGRALPETSWMVLPLLGLVGAGLRRSGIARCKRCERTLCAHCAPENRDAAICVRCVRLFEARHNVDARVRKEQLEIDRRRQRRLDLRAAVLSLFAPGFDALRRGRCTAGTLQLGCVALGLALFLSPHWIAAPWDVGPLAHWTALVGGAVLLVPSYAGGLLQAARLARGRGGRR
jgi:tetratricopeptide (TPR) repeat protein